MSKQKNVKTFLGRLESSVKKQDGWKTLQLREAQQLHPYIENDAYPGKGYVYIGHSENLEHPLVGSEIHVHRKTCLSLLFETRADKNSCVNLDKALNFPDFPEILSRFEKELMLKLPANTMIGPAYNACGEKLGTAFTIWRALSVERKSPDRKEEKKPAKVLLKSGSRS